MIYVVTLALAVPLIIWKAYVFTVLFAWFIVPLGLPAIGIPHAVGIMAIISLLTVTRGDRKEREWDQVSRLVAIGVLSPAISLLIGWIALLFMP